jgi:single-strand DNA-binding protein
MASNFNFNKAILGGRLTADPELKTTVNSVSVTSFRLAVNRRYKDEQGKQDTDFINVTAWRGQAEFICRYFKKGSNICIVGSIQSRTWTDKKGEKRYEVEVVADEAYFCETKQESGGNGGAADDDLLSQLKNTYGSANFEDMSKDDDLPF